MPSNKKDRTKVKEDFKKVVDACDELQAKIDKFNEEADPEKGDDPYCALIIAGSPEQSMITGAGTMGGLKTSLYMTLKQNPAILEVVIHSIRAIKRDQNKNGSDRENTSN